MTKTQKLELENLVLKNIIDCIQESLEELKNSDDEGGYPLFVGSVMSCIDNLDSNVENALSWGYTLDYRHSAFYADQPDGMPVKIYPASRGDNHG